MTIKKNLVVQSNELICSKSSLSKTQTKIILTAISLIEKGVSNLEKYYVIPIDEFIEGSNLESRSSLARIEEIAKEIVGKVLKIRRSDGTILVTSWASSIIVDKEKGLINIRFDESLHPYLLDLKSFFTKYELKNILLLNSQSAIRLYQLLRQYLNLGFLEIDIDDLKNILASKTISFGSFKQNVLIPCEKDIQEKTDISFSFEERKIRRKVVSLKFHITSDRTNKLTSSPT